MSSLPVRNIPFEVRKVLPQYNRKTKSWSYILSGSNDPISSAFYNVRVDNITTQANLIPIFPHSTRASHTLVSRI